MFSELKFLFIFKLMLNYVYLLKKLLVFILVIDLIIVKFVKKMINVFYLFLKIFQILLSYLFKCFENYDFNFICKYFMMEKIFLSKMFDNVGFSFLKKDFVNINY